MTDRRDTAATLQALAAFRHELRSFLQFSEQAAARHGVQAQQHQLLLQVAGAAEDAAVTVAYLAERLGLKHNSTVELVDRSAEAGLVERVADAEDHRRIRLHLTARGAAMLAALSDEHAAELNERAPRLIATLRKIQQQRPEGPGADADALLAEGSRKASVRSLDRTSDRNPDRTNDRNLDRISNRSVTKTSAQNLIQTSAAPDHKLSSR